MSRVLSRGLVFVACLCVVACSGAPRRDASASRGGPGDDPGTGIAAGAFRFEPQIGMPGDVWGIDISPQGELAALTVSNGSVRIWDLRSHLLVRTIPKAASAAAFVSAERVAFVRGAAVAIVDVVTGKDALILSDPAPPQGLKLTHFAAAPGSDELALAYQQGQAAELVVWDVGSKKVLWRRRTATAVGDLAVSPAGRRVAVAVGEQVHLYGADSDDRIATLEGLEEKDRGKRLRVGGLAFAHAGDKLVSLIGGKATVWDVDEQTVLHRFPRARVAAFSADGKRLVTSGEIMSFKAGEGTMTSWSLETGQVASKVFGAADTVALAISDNGEYVVSAGRRGAAWVANTRTRDNRHLNLGSGKAIRSLALTKGSQLVMSGLGGTHLWDLQTGRVAEQLAKGYGPPYLAVSPDGGLLLGHADKRFVFSLDGSQRPTFDVEARFFYAAAFAPDGGRVAFGVFDGDGMEPLRLYDAHSGKEMYRVAVPSGDERLDWVLFSGDGKLLIASDGEGKVSVHDAASGGARGNLEVDWTCLGVPSSEHALVAGASPRTNMVAIACKNTITLWDAATQQRLHQIDAGAPVRSLAFAPDGEIVAVGTVDGVLTLYRADTGASIRQLRRHRSSVEALAYSPDGRLLASGTDEGMVRLEVIDASGAAPSVSLMTSKSEWLMFADDGLFDASRQGGSLGSIVVGPRAYRLDQMSYLLNRPDLLLERMGIGSPEAIAYLKGRHHARLAKIGGAAPDAARSLRVPSARIDGVRKKKDGLLDLDLSCSDRSDELASFNIFVDGVAVHGLKGKRLQGKEATFRETIQLLPGFNRVEFSCTNRGGAEALRVETTVRHHTRTKQRSDLYFLGFGVSKHRDRRLNLSYAHRDALELGKRFAKMRPRHGFRKAHTQVHTNEEVTTANIKRAKRFLDKARVQDIVILFIAGHGVHGRDGRYYFITHDANVRKLSSTAANFDLVEDLLVGIRARRKLFLMDTCQSGEERGPAPTLGKKARGLRVRNVRGLELASDPPSRAARPTTDGLYQRDRFIENDVRRRSGAVVLSSSRGDQLSFENDGAQHGLFTKAVLAALKNADSNRDSQVSTDELLTHVRDAVSRASGGAQTPIIDRDNPQIRIALPTL